MYPWISDHKKPGEANRAWNVEAIPKENFKAVTQTALLLYHLIWGCSDIRWYLKVI